MQRADESPTKVKVGKTHPDTPSGTPDSGAKSVTFSAPDIMKELDSIRTLVTTTSVCAVRRRSEER
eukprot:2505717-Rhodomonas_salina.1